MKAVIMVGGKGTRISTISTTIPKCMLEIKDIPLLTYHIENLKKYGVHDIILIINHLGDVIKEYYKDGKKFGVVISYIVEKEPLGTAGSLYYLKEIIDDDFILLYGDIYSDINYQKMIAFHKKNRFDITMFSHPNAHPFDSDLIISNEDRVLKIDSKHNDRTNYDYDNLVNAGIYIINPRVLNNIKEVRKRDLEHDIIIPMLEDNTYLIGAYKSTEYAKDMGTPERYHQVNIDCEKKIPEQRNLDRKQKCIFLDRDGTINKHVGLVTKKEQLELLPTVIDAIKKINQSSYLAIVVTNQPVVARGDCTFDELHNIHKHLVTLLGNGGAYIDDLFYCPHHPDRGYENEVKELKIKCECRKPQPKLVLDAMEKYNIDLSKSYIIGDTTSDMKLGNDLGMKTILVKTGEMGLDGKHDCIKDDIADSLLEAVNIILEGKEN